MHIMIRSRFVTVGVVALLAGAVVGCQQPKMNLDEMMKPPPRPVELDQLNDLVGTWQSTWEMTMPGADKPITGKGKDTFKWDADKWVLEEDVEGTMGSNRMVSASFWTWNPQRKLFEFYGADNFGMIMTGTGKYDAATRTWHMKGETNDTVHGRKSSGEGTMKVLDKNSLEFNWVEWDCLHMSKFMEMKGTSRRQ
jgi:hypothetical protein